MTEDIERDLSLVTLNGQPGLNKNQVTASGDTQQKKPKRCRKRGKCPSIQVSNEEQGNAQNPSTPSQDSITRKKGSKNIQKTAQALTPKSEKERNTGIVPIYVIQLLSKTQKDSTLGVFLSATDANNHALNFMHVWLGIMEHEMTDERGVFGHAKNSEVKARRRMWAATGTMEILSAAGEPGVRVVKKDLYGEGLNKGDTIYLSIDSSFVLGAYKSKDGRAWEACKKYWTDLSVAASMEGLRHWYDEKGDPHGEAIIAGHLHQWSLERYLLL